MPSSLIQVSPELLEGKSNELRGYKSEHDEAMNKMRTLVTNLNEIWKGSAQDAFLAKYESMQGTFTQFSEMLENYAKLMDSTAKTLRDADNAAGSTINGSM